MNAQERERMRLAVHAALRRAFPERVDQPFDDWKKPGGLQLVHDHLCELVEIVRAQPDADPEVWREQIEARICPGCRERFSSGFCYYRKHNVCSLNTTIGVVGEAIRRELKRETVSPDRSSSSDDASATPDSHPPARLH